MKPLEELEKLGFVSQLARVYSDESAAEFVIAAAGIPIENLKPFRSTTPTIFWSQVCVALDNGLIADGLSQLVSASHRQYPGNLVFRDAQRAVSGTGPAFTPTSDTWITWIHVSDLHWGHGDATHQVDQERVLRALSRDARAMLAAVGKPDMILVSGDIAHGGKAEQYQLATAWLMALAQSVGLTASRILVVPGNHDVDREATKPNGPRNLHEQLRSDRRLLDTLLVTPNGLDPVWAKFDAYTAFSQSFGAPLTTSVRPWWALPVVTRLGSIVVLGLNSCLACYNNEDAPSNLLLGTKQIQDALNQVPEDALAVIVHHHPPQWLQDGSILMNQVQRRPHLHFSGHVHRQGGGIYNEFHSNGTLQFVAGAAHDNKGEATEYTYSWGRVSRTRLEYFPRIWVDARDEFVPNAVTFSLDPRGARLHSIDELPGPLRAWLSKNI